MRGKIFEKVKHPLVIYDGYCHLCTATVKFLIKTDRKKKLRFTPLQSRMAARLSKDTQIKLKKSRGVALYYDHQFRFKSEAIFKIFTILGGGYRLLNIFSLLPLPVSNRLYDFISENRYKWFGHKKEMHGMKEDPERFILDPAELS